MSKRVKVYHTFLFTLATLLYLFLQFTVFKKNFWNPDEGYLLTEGKLLEHGEHLYGMVIDRKTPLLFIIYFIAIKAFGVHAMAFLHLLFIALKCVSAFLLYKIMRYFTDNKLKQLSVIPIYLLLTLTFPVSASMAANFESLTVFFLVLSYFTLLYHRYILLGIFAALAFLSEQRAVFFIAHIAIYLVLYNREHRRNILKTSLSFLGVFALFSPIILKKSAIFWIFRASENYINPLSVIKLSLYNIVTYFGIVIIALLIPIIGKSILDRKTPVSKHTGFLSCYILCGFIAVTLTFHFFDHYFTFLIPQISLLAALLLPDILIPLQLVLSFIIAFNMIYSNVRIFNPLHRRLIVMGAIVNQLSKPKDRVLLWTMYPEIYVYANRLPGTRFLTPGFVFNYSAIADYNYVGIKYGIKGSAKQLLKDAERYHVKIIIDDCNNQSICSLNLVPGFHNFLSKYYRIVAIVESAVIYQRII